MEVDLKKLNIKIRGNDKKEISRLLMIITALNILISILVVIFANIKIFKTIIVYIMSLVYVGVTIYIIKKENGKILTKPKESFQNKYDPILTRFFIKNEFILDHTLLNAEIYYLLQKEYIEIDKEKNVLKLKDRSKFKQIDALEKINSEKIKEYSTDEIPSYESMFISKILFAFHDEIDLNEFKRNRKENYYLQRGEICKLAMEKMILYELEKKNMMGQTNNLNYVSIAGILNMITTILLFLVIARFNIILLLATMIHMALNAILIKNENILSYKYSDDIIKYMDDLEEYVEELKIEKTNLTVKELEQESVEKVMINENKSEEQDIEKSNAEKLNAEKEKMEGDKQLKLLFGIETDQPV